MCFIALTQVWNLMWPKGPPQLLLTEPATALAIDLDQYM